MNDFSELRNIVYRQNKHCIFPIRLWLIHILTIDSAWLVRNMHSWTTLTEVKENIPVLCVSIDDFVSTKMFKPLVKVLRHLNVENRSVGELQTWLRATPNVR